MIIPVPSCSFLRRSCGRRRSVQSDAGRLGERSPAIFASIWADNSRACCLTSFSFASIPAQFFRREFRHGRIVVKAESLGQ